MEHIEAVGIMFDEGTAYAARDSYNTTKLLLAGGNENNLVERAYVQMIAFRGSIKGWLVRLETRDTMTVGEPWPLAK